MTVFEATNRITSAYGMRTYTNNGRIVNEFHRGIDLVATAFPGQGVPESAWNVREVTGGTVLRIRQDASRGKYVDVQTEKGTFERYQHLQSICVKVGQRVLQGAVLGVAGSTGNSTGRHLHFGVYRGGTSESCAINPALWLGLPNKTGKYQGNNTVDGVQAPIAPPAKPKRYTVTLERLSAGDSAKAQALAKELSVGCTVKEVS